MLHSVEIHSEPHIRLLEVPFEIQPNIVIYVKIALSAEFQTETILGVPFRIQPKNSLFDGISNKTLLRSALTCSQPFSSDLRYPWYPCKGQDMAISKIISELNIAGVVRFRLHVLK